MVFKDSRKVEAERSIKNMSYMKGDLLTRTRKLVKGLAKAEPAWLKAMERFVSVLLPFCYSHLDVMHLFLACFS